LAIFLTIDRRVTVSLGDLQMEATPGEVVTGNDFIYYWHIQTDGSTDSRATSFLIGKKIISGYPKSQCGMAPFHEKKKNLDFIIGMDKDNKPILQNCSPDTYNGRDLYLRTVLFRREVLKKYLDYPERYSIEDGILRCGQRWMISIDNNHNEGVGVFLGDLARDMPESEQNHWTQFNIIAESGPSQVSLDRNFWCLFTEPLSADLRFKSTYEKFCDNWKGQMGWHLFLPPNEGDKHVFTQLHAPTSESISEFENQISNLSRILVEPINESELSKLLDANTIKEKNLRGIGKLEEWLNTSHGATPELDILVLRQIQSLRNGIGHRKGEKFEKTSKDLNLESRSKIEVIIDLLTRAEKLLINIEALVLTSNCYSKDKSVR
ncbi:MAG: hypothetical protein KIT34_18880, partial [Cyanobacteria bacterium TGS_CYA1]|nr:hypothetical protein [Cyanobacteria bacterium TGS_CYA1]